MDLVRPNDEIRVGGEIESQCKKCGRATTHRVINMKADGAPGQCECLACKGKHAYRKPAADPAALRPGQAAAQTVRSRKKAAAEPGPGAGTPDAVRARAASAPAVDPLGSITEVAGFGQPDSARPAGSFGAAGPFGASVPASARPARPSRAKKDAKAATPPGPVTEELLEDVEQAFAEENEMAGDLSDDEDDEFVSALAGVGDELVSALSGGGAALLDEEDGPTGGGASEPFPAAESGAAAEADDGSADDPYGVEAAIEAADGGAPGTPAKTPRLKDAKAGGAAAKGAKAKEPAKKTAKPRPGAKERSKGLEEAEAILRKEWEEMRAAVPSKVAAYSLEGAFGQNQHIQHPAFGLGIVKSVIPPNKILVNFERGLKVLIMMVRPREAGPAA
ncbi:MAG: hypothetical protein LBQ12_05030 [Deltaproteobacteria bacterium]|jgi:hypothetical protein|nr:hypothetical protein [Deltaproteobacteria bacterium]